MIVDLEIRPDNPIYAGCEIREVKREGKTTYCLKAKPTQETADLIDRNFIILYRHLPRDELPVQFSGSAPNWVYLIISHAARTETPLKKFEYKKGKYKITLPS